MVSRASQQANRRYNQGNPRALQHPLRWGNERCGKGEADNMSILDITFGQILLYAGIIAILLFIFVIILALISKTIDWVWWKKENRRDFDSLRYFLRHRDEIIEAIKNKK